MKQKTIFRTAAAAALAIPATMAVAAVPMTVEQQMAQQEQARIIKSPIGGVENSHWFDYRINVTETQKELASDLRRASDLEDTRDAYSEFAYELKDNRQDYVEYMAKKGYRVPRVYLEN
ncbi:hypothetical protein I5E68_11465 [Novosphingobium sp. YJ-S2-02]|uniref:DUF4148 domain-containing protein n=1 Tax=Novosphingobium aureum TaxID=2792964 RepID=A0A931HDR1_9SPHN|nr:hypothetical protein [Novosphingobium aureum]MBH0113568.1 hypothetical protein [Novosphingobium aureum]